MPRQTFSSHFVSLWRTWRSAATGKVTEVHKQWYSVQELLFKSTYSSFIHYIYQYLIFFLLMYSLVSLSSIARSFAPRISAGRLGWVKVN